jgi:hypothetical protein
LLGHLHQKPKRYQLRVCLSSWRIHELNYGIVHVLRCRLFSLDIRSCILYSLYYRCGQLLYDCDNRVTEYFSMYMSEYLYSVRRTLLLRVSSLVCYVCERISAGECNAHVRSPGYYLSTTSTSSTSSSSSSTCTACAVNYYKDGYNFDLTCSSCPLTYEITSNTASVKSDCGCKVDLNLSEDVTR